MKRNLVSFALFFYAGIVVLTIAYTYNNLATTTKPEKEPFQIYGGIEIGSTGPRYCVIALNNRTRPSTYTIIAEDTFIIDFKDANFNRNGSINTEEFLENININTMIRKIKLYVRDSRNIFIAVGSAYQNRTNLKTLKEKIKARYPDYEGQIKYLTKKEEGFSNFLTVIDGTPHEQRLVIDIGSSDIKFAGVNEEFRDYAEPIPLGSLVIEDRVSNNDSTNYQKEVFNLIDNRIKQMKKMHLFKNKKIIYLTGGAVYKITKMLKKNTSCNPSSFSKHDLDLCSIKLDSMSHEKRDTISDSSERQMKIDVEIVRCILNNFYPDSIYFFARKSWIPGYIITEVSPPVSE